MPDVMTVEEVAARWRVPAKNVRGKMADGKIPAAFKVGRQWRISLADVIDYENRHKVKLTK
jgi:excisionase family DNA binding protein